jgi:hypothetical protein
MLKDITLRSISALHGAAPRNEKQMVAKATIGGESYNSLDPALVDSLGDRQLHCDFLCSGRLVKGP